MTLKDICGIDFFHINDLNDMCDIDFVFYLDGYRINGTNTHFIVTKHSRPKVNK